MRKLIAATALAGTLTFIAPLNTVHAQDAAAEDDDDGDKTGLWGLAGLLGLIGLAGLKRRDDRYDSRNTTTGTSSVR